MPISINVKLTGGNMTTSDQQNESSLGANGNHLSISPRILRVLGFGLIAIVILVFFARLEDSYWVENPFMLGTIAVFGGVLAITTMRFTQWRKSASSLSWFATFFLGALISTAAVVIVLFNRNNGMVEIEVIYDGMIEIEVVLAIIYHSLLATLVGLVFRAVLLSDHLSMPLRILHALSIGLIAIAILFFSSMFKDLNWVKNLLILGTAGVIGGVLAITVIHLTQWRKSVSSLSWLAIFFLGALISTAAVAMVLLNRNDKMITITDNGMINVVLIILAITYYSLLVTLVGLIFRVVLLSVLYFLKHSHLSMPLRILRALIIGFFVIANLFFFVRIGDFYGVKDPLILGTVGAIGGVLAITAMRFTQWRKSASSLNWFVTFFLGALISTAAIVILKDDRMINTNDEILAIIHHSLLVTLVGFLFRTILLSVLNFLEHPMVRHTEENITTSDQQNESYFGENRNHLSIPLRILRALGMSFIAIIIFFFFSNLCRVENPFMLGTAGVGGVLAITAMRFTQWHKSVSSLNWFVTFFLGALISTAAVAVVLFNNNDEMTKVILLITYHSLLITLVGFIFRAILPLVLNFWERLMIRHTEGNMITSDQQNKAFFGENGNNLSISFRILRALCFGFVGIFIFDNIFLLSNLIFRDGGREGGLFMLGVGGGSGVLAITAIRFTQWHKSTSSVSRFAALFFLGALFGTVVGMALYMLYMPSPSTTSTGPWVDAVDYYRPPSWIIFILIILISLLNGLLVTLGAVTFRAVLLSVLGIWKRPINYCSRLAVTFVVAVLCFFGASVGALTQICGKIIGFEVMDRGYGYARTNAFVFHHGIPLIGVDAPTFEIYYGSLSITRDKNRVYFWDRPISGADPATFEHIGSWLFRDRRAVYLGACRTETV